MAHNGGHTAAAAITFDEKDAITAADMNRNLDSCDRFDGQKGEEK